MQIREMQSKIIKRYHFSPVRMAIITKTKDKQWQRCEEQKYVGTLCGMQTALVTMESIMEVPQNIKKNKATIKSSNPPPPGNISKRNKNRISKRYLHSCVY